MRDIVKSLKVSCTTCVLGMATCLLVAAPGGWGDFVELMSPNAVPQGGFGFSVVGMGDVNGDGLGDAAVGAPFETVSGFTEAGRAYIFDGSTGDVLFSLVSPNPEVSGQFGASLGRIPNSFGGADGLVVGAPDEDIGPAINAGRAYVIDGSGSLLSILESTNVNEPFSGGGFGHSVAGVPDINGDFTGEVLVGAYLEGPDLSRIGRAYIFSGISAPIVTTLISPNAAPDSMFGSAVAGIRDIDGDGSGDIIVGAENETVGGFAGAGRVYVFSGRTTGLLGQISSPNAAPGQRFGSYVAAAPDMDGDTIDDILVGAPFEDIGGLTKAGRAYLFSGATRALIAVLQAPTPTQDEHFGVSLSSVPDLNGDAQADLIIGTESPAGEGPVYIFDGATRRILSIIESPMPNPAGGFGSAVSGMIDATGDGIGDFIVGAKGEDFPGALGSGRAYIFDGLAAMSGLLTGTVTNLATGEPNSCATIIAKDNGFDAGVADFFAFSDFNGFFSFEGLPAGDYAVEVHAPGLTSNTFDVTIVGGIKQNVDFELSPSDPGGTIITGTVTETTSGNQLGGVRVEAFDAVTSASLGLTFSCADGAYEIRFFIGAPAKGVVDVLLSFSSPFHEAKDVSVEVTLGEPNLADASLVPKSLFAGLVTGIVNAAETGEAIEGARVSAQLFGQSISAAAFSGPLGAYTIAGLGQGLYQVSATAPDFDLELVSLALDTEGETLVQDFSLIRGDNGVGPPKTPGCGVFESAAGGGTRPGIEYLVSGMIIFILLLLSKRNETSVRRHR